MLRRWIILNLKGLVSLCLLGCVVLTRAQDRDCPAIVQAALDSTAEQCGATGRNQVCYGNVNLEASPQPEVSDFSLNAPGDIEAVSSIASLSLSSKIEEEGEWGIALMTLQANLPDTLPGQNVTFLLFGDVQVQNGVSSSVEPVTLEARAQGDVDVRRRPSADEIPVTTVSDGDTVSAIGRNAAGTWLYVSLDDRTGWVSAGEIEAAGDIETLNLVDPTGAPLSPMQAFYFRSGIGVPACAEVPESGILVQTPEGAEQIQFTVNNANITLGSTAYFQAQPLGEMTISVLEGEATVEVEGVVVEAPAGSRVRVPVNDQGHAFGAPSEPEAYDGAKLAVVPLRLMPVEITIAEPASAEALAEALVIRAPGSAHSIIIRNQADWVDSGITVSMGQSFAIEAHGGMNPCLDTYPNGAEYCIFFAPQGSPFVVTENNEFGVFPALGHRFMALVGRIGDGEPFYIGAGGDFVADRAGTLWFTPNDNTRTDNRGAFHVLVWLEDN